MGNLCSGSSYEAASKRKQSVGISLTNQGPSCPSCTDLEKTSARTVATEADIQAANKGIQCQLLDSSTALRGEFSSTKLCHCLWRSPTLSKQQSGKIIEQINSDIQADCEVLLKSSHNPTSSVAGLHEISDMHNTTVLNFLPTTAAGQVWNESRISEWNEPYELGQMKYSIYPPTGTADKHAHYCLSAQELPSNVSNRNANLIYWSGQLHVGNDNPTTAKDVIATKSANVQAYSAQNFDGPQLTNQLSAKQFSEDGTTNVNVVRIRCNDKRNHSEPISGPLSCRCKSVPALPTHYCVENRTCPQTGSNGIQISLHGRSHLSRCNSRGSLWDIRPLNHALTKRTYPSSASQKHSRLSYSPELAQHHVVLSTGPEQPSETNPCGTSKLRRPDCRPKPDPVNTHHNCYLLSTPFETSNVSTSILPGVMPLKILTANSDFTEFTQVKNEPRHTISMRCSEPAKNDDLSVLSPVHYFEPMSFTLHPQTYTSHLYGSQPNFASVVEWYRPVTRVFEENQASYHKRLRYVPQQVAGTQNPSTCEQVTFSHTGDVEEAPVVPIPYSVSHSPTICHQVAKSWYPVRMEPVKTSPTRSLVAKSSCGAGKRPRSISQTEPPKRAVKTDINVSNTTLFYASQPRGTLKYRFFLKDSCGIDKVIADPTDRRIRAICDRFQCDLEVYSKVPKNGYMQFVVDISSPSLWALHSCTRALDSSLNWCLSPQLLRSSSNGLPPK